MSEMTPEVERPGPGGTYVPAGAGMPAGFAENRERVEEFIKENPVLSLTAALAVGYLLGRAVAGLTRR